MHYADDNFGDISVAPSTSSETSDSQPDHHHRY